jgi:hypothetical protein
MRTHSLADLPGVPKRFDRLFWHRVRMARFGPDIHFARSYEIEEPFRLGKCLVLHLEPFRTGLVLGWYSREGQEEHVALRRAVSLRKPSQRDLDVFDENVTQRPSEHVGIRFSASGGRPPREPRPGPRMVVVDDIGAE